MKGMKVLKQIKFVIKICRISLLILNSLAILFALYFMISRKDLAFQDLSMSLAFFRDIRNGLRNNSDIRYRSGRIWRQKEEETSPLRLVFTYAFLSTIMFINGAICAAVYIRHMSIADIIFAVLAVILSLLVLPTAFGYGFVLKKTRTLKRLNLV